MTCAHVRLLGPCFKTGRVDYRPTSSRLPVGPDEKQRQTWSTPYHEHNGLKFHRDITVRVLASYRSLPSPSATPGKGDFHPTDSLRTPCRGRTCNTTRGLTRKPAATWSAPPITSGPSHSVSQRIFLEPQEMHRPSSDQHSAHR